MRFRARVIMVAKRSEVPIPLRPMTQGDFWHHLRWEFNALRPWGDFTVIRWMQ